MNEKLKVGVFGAYRGKTMINVLSKHPDARLVAVCDKYRPLLDEVEKLAGEAGIDVAVYEDFEDFFRHDMDAVFLPTTPTSTRRLPYACSSPAGMCSARYSPAKPWRRRWHSLKRSN
jgi:predicted dehydrogenase